MLRNDPLMMLEVNVGQPVDCGMVEGIQRRCIPIVGGRVSGAYTGIVLSGGADWQEILPSGTLEIDARYVLELEEGRMEVQSRGIRAGPLDVLGRLALGEAVPPSEYYFRTFIRFYSASPALARFNHMLALGRGERKSESVILTVHEVE